MASEHRTRISAGGRVVIPAPFRRALGVGVGDEIILVQGEDGVIRITTPARALERARRAVRRYVDGDRRLSDELIAERRREYDGD